MGKQRLKGKDDDNGNFAPENILRMICFLKNYYNTPEQQINVSQQFL